MMRQRNFAPILPAAGGAGYTKTLVPTAASQTVAFDAAVIALRDELDVLITNDSSATCFYRAATTADAAVITDTPIRPGGVQIVSIAKGDRMSVISTGTPTGNIYFTPGYGS